jgi:ATP-dependent Clp protease ATP-binding subunit ClpA
MMVTRFTKHVRTIVNAAEVEARATGSPTVEAEHVLLAISALEGTEAQRVLASAGLDHHAIKLALKREVHQSLSAAGITIDPGQLPHATIDPSRHLRLGASARIALERAVKASAGARQIQPCHLLIGVLGAQAGTVPRMLALAGVDQGNLTERVRSATDGTTQ